MRMAAIGFAGGAAVLQTRAALPQPSTIALAAATALVMVVIAVAAPAALARPAHSTHSAHSAAHDRRARSWLRAAALLLAGAVAGFLWAAWLAHCALAPALARQDEGKDFVIVGTIDSLPSRFAQGVRFHVAVEQVLDRDGVAMAPAPVPPRIAVSWYSRPRERGDRAGDAVANPVDDIAPGARWRLTVRLQRPHGNANPHGFDYEAWLLEQGVRATGYVRPDRGNRRLDAFVVTAHNLVERSRAALRSRIERALDGKPYAGVIVALVVGDQRGIGASDWQVFNRTGIGHLVSISGLHITMVAGLFALIASALWRHSFLTGARLPLLLPAQKVAALAGAAAALAYVLLAGFGVPAQRTLYMLLVVAAALWLNRLSDLPSVLCTALAVVVAIDPWAVLWPGFWLSFGAVAIIVYATVGRTRARAVRTATGAPPPGTPSRAAAWRGQLGTTLRAAGRTQYAVTLGLVPLTMLLFGQVSIVSPLANAVAIPLISLIVTPLALVGSMLPWPLAVPVLSMAHWLIAALAVCLEWFSSLRYAVWTAPVPPLWMFCWAMCGTLWLLAPRGWPVRWLGLAAWIPLLAAGPAHPAPGRMTVTAFDVGQGMALLIETSGHRLLYDTGPAYGPDNDAGGRVLVPYLRARGIGRLDGVVVSHSDSDHAGGALTVLENIDTAWVLSSLGRGHPIAQAARRHGHCAAGQRWTWDGVTFDMLHPPPASYSNAGMTSNARSCTLRITAGSKSMLLAGDIEAAQEAQLVASDASRLRADVLLAPHHGSGTSSTRDFLLAVQPQVAIFQVGYRNRYQHPKREVYERYGALGIRRLRTDDTGALTLQFGSTVDLASYRRTDARYWHGR
ncbi:MAG: DNA internalization-related competence protein ComEC/Rec2 [Duganella sp.]